MITISSLTPLNVQEEKAKFLADPAYNPQFTYAEPISETELTKYGLPKPQNLEIANYILKSTFNQHTPTQITAMQGDLLTETEVKESIATFLHLHHLDTRLSVTYSASYISRTTMTADQLRIRLPMRYRRRGLQGMLYHEIGTHALRRVNYEQQPWYRKKSQYGFAEYLPTEEGLATLHSRIPHQCKAAIAQALHYLAISTAQTRSFAEVWQTIKPYTESLEQCWTITLRSKRGISNTAMPGASTKDLLYLDGMIAVWRWLQQHEFDCTPLYLGKVALEDVPKAIALNPSYVPQLPLFFTKDRAKYTDSLLEIGKVNGLLEL